ncbi:(deoxy)nucleoside triphosphate pyrophosphohydrolase [Neobacillus niacini]|uniref:(deoxy)nucleoside triphosphate pyrophosphohydrolase n=1 Tax=Neobacillus niacini TaxID=86668 RepID=UPI003983B746
MKKIVKVVEAIIENEEHEILCALRSPNMTMPNMWEFPGGKVEVNEDIYSALEREIEEELGCRIVTTGEVYNENIHEYEAFIVHLISIKCSVIEGAPTPSEHSKLIWLKRQNLDSLTWAPADVPIVNILKLEE